MEGFKQLKRIVAVTVVFAAAVVFTLAGAESGHAGAEIKYDGPKAKYVFFFIGDGVGSPQRTAAEQYTGKRLYMDQLPIQAITTTYANDRFITGSAASATALATGQKTNINYIGVDPQYKPVKTIAEMAKEKGWKVGIVSSVSIDHATPASFYAHVKTRKMYHEIDYALAESGFDFFGGGGLKDPAGKKSKKPLGDALAKAKENGYKLISNKADFMKLTPADGKVVAWNEWLQDGGAMPYAMDMTDNDITLPRFTEKAVEMLDNEKGFFLMVEGGKIDWACHANDAVASIKNTIAFDESLKVALDFMNAHPNDTLIVMTGDHECGGLTLGFAGTGYGSYFDILGGQNVSFQKFTDEIVKGFKGDFSKMKPIITKHFGLKFKGDAKADKLVLADHEIDMIKNAFEQSMQGDKVKSKDPMTAILYGGYDPLTVQLTHTLNNKAGLAWTSYKHTGVPVPTSAAGIGSHIFQGYYDNTDVAKKIMAVMGIEAKVYHVDAEQNDMTKVAAQ